MKIVQTNLGTYYISIYILDPFFAIDITLNPPYCSVEGILRDCTNPIIY